MPIAILALLGTGIVNIFIHEEEILSLPSPRNDVVAKVTQFDGGATTGYSHTVEIFSTSLLGFRSAVVAKLVDTYDGFGEPGVHLQWVGTNELLLEFERGDLELATTRVTVEGVTYEISYANLARNQ